jgi:phospholipid transport system substrate-binding protein
MRTVVLTALTVVMLAGAARAEDSPAALVRSEVANVLAILDDPSLDADTRRKRLSDSIARRFDFVDMSRSILAQRWQDATGSERERFIALFRRLLEKTYLGAIEKRTTEVVNVGGERVRGDQASVIVTIERGRAADIPLLFKLKRSDIGWMVYDTNVEGLSIVSHYRDALGAIASNEGMDGVLAWLEQRVS